MSPGTPVEELGEGLKGIVTRVLVGIFLPRYITFPKLVFIDVTSPKGTKHNIVKKS